MYTSRGVGVTALRALLGEGGACASSPFSGLVLAVRSEERAIFPGEREGARGVLAHGHLRHAGRVGWGVRAQVGSMSSITSYYLS